MSFFLLFFLKLDEFSRAFLCFRVLMGDEGEPWIPDSILSPTPYCPPLQGALALGGPGLYHAPGEILVLRPENEPCAQ